MKIHRLIEDAKLDRLVQRIQAALDPSLLKPQWRQKVADDPTLHCTTGHCYAASEALWYALGGMDGPWRPMTGKDEEGTHWWLVNTETGETVDVTAEQYTSRGKEPPYHTGKRIGFLTKNPSKRAQAILRKAGVNTGA